jgi:PAS domain S-box-containing protein
MKPIVRLSLIVILVLSPGLAAAQARTTPFDVRHAPGSLVRFIHLSQDDGLSQNAGLAFLQDSHGFMWIGTQDGLNRYDGQTFTVFKNDPDDPGSLSNNSINALAEDRDGFLWIATWGGGLNRFDPRTQQFTRFQHDPDNPISLSNDTVTSILQDSAGAIWIGTLGGLDRLDPQSNSFIHFRNAPGDPFSLSSDAVSTIFEDSRGALWIGTGGFGTPGVGLNRLDRTTGKFTRYIHDPLDLQSIGGDNIAAIVEAPDAALWIGLGGYGVDGAGVDRLDPRTGAITHFKHDEAAPDSLSNDRVMDLAADEAGDLWISTYVSGLNRMSFAAPGHFEHFRHNPYFPDSLSGDETWTLLKDRSGMLWVGTARSGLNLLPANSGQFNLYRHVPDDPASLAMDAVGAFAEDTHGGTWLATWGAGIDRFDPATGKFDHVVANPEDPNSLSSDLVMALSVDAQDKLWAATLGGGLNRYDPAIAQVKRYTHDQLNPQSLIGDNVVSLLPDGDAGLWVGTFSGLDYFDRKSETFTHYLNDPNNPQSLSFDQAVSLFRDHDNQLWVGTYGGGLNQLDLNNPDNRDPAQAQFTIFRHDPENPNSLSNDAIFAMHQAADGTLWFGTQGGLNRFEPQTQTFRAYREKQGMPNDTVLGILEDDAGYLWITTNNGLAKFDPRTELFTIYTVADGLQSNEFNSNAYFRSRDGTMYIGGVHGFNLFRPENVQPNPVPPPVAVTRFAVFNQPQDVDLSGQTPIQLSYEQDFISFDFAALDFNKPAKNQYAYKLEGFDQDWIEAGTRPYASYTNVPGGNYTFRVKASNGDGVWNAVGVSLPIEITPPIWETWPFQLAVILGVVSLAVFGFQWRVRSVREQNARLQIMVDEQKRVEVELRQSEARFRSIFENSPVGINILNMERKVLDVNPAMCQMLGYSREELVGKTPAFVTHPDDQPRADQKFQELLSDQSTSNWDERRYFRKNGEEFWAQITVSVVRDQAGQPLYLVGMAIDVSEQRRILAELKESEARFKAIFENSAVGMGLMSMDRIVLDSNPAMCAMLGYTREELIGQSPVMVTYPDDFPSSTEAFQKLISGEASHYVAERRYVRKNSEIFWTQISMSMVRDPQGQPLYLVGLINDIDAQKRAAERLAAQDAEHRQDLERRIAERTTELNLANELLREKAAQDAVTAERTRLARDLHDAVTQTLFSASLIAEVLPDLWDMNQPEGRKRLEELRQLTRGALAEMRTLLVELRPNALVDVPLPVLLKQLCESFIGRARLPVQLSVDGNRTLPPDIQMAFYRITQEALNNIVKHAKATQVIVTLRLDGVVRLAVADNGVGFDPASVPPDHLGTKIMRERAETIGATYSLYSEPGEGTQISITWEVPHPAPPSSDTLRSTGAGHEGAER